MWTWFLVFATDAIEATRGGGGRAGGLRDLRRDRDRRDRLLGRRAPRRPLGADADDGGDDGRLRHVRADDRAPVRRAALGAPRGRARVGLHRRRGLGPVLVHRHRARRPDVRRNRRRAAARGRVHADDRDDLADPVPRGRRSAGEWAFAFLAPGPALGVVAMLRLRGRRPRRSASRAADVRDRSPARAVVGKASDAHRIAGSHRALGRRPRRRSRTRSRRGLGMHVIERTDKFTLDRLRRAAREADALRRRGPARAGRAQAHRAAGERPCRPRASSSAPRRPRFRTGSSSGSWRRRPRSSTTSTTWLFTPAIPPAAAQEYLDLGFAEAPRRPGRRGPRSRLRARSSSSTRATRRTSGKPLLNHLAVLVPSADDLLERGERTCDLQIANVVDAENTKAVFVWGPEGVKIEYVEHKATFSLV